MTQIATPREVVDGKYDMATGQAVQPLNQDEWTTTVALGRLEDPGTPNDHFIAYAIGKDRQGGRPVSITVALLEGDEELVRFSHPDVQAGMKQIRQPIPPAAAARIKDYNNLRVQMHFKRGN